MKVKFDAKKLTDILTDFYNFTGVTITIFDAEFNTVTGYPDFMPAYCAKVREDGERHKNCLKSDIAACKKSCELRGSYSYICHAGVNETVTPVYYENIIVGYILFGQYARSGDSLKTVKDCADSYGLNLEEMKEYHSNLKVLSENQVSSAINILKICIAKIWLDELIKLEDNMLTASIQVFIGNNLNLALTADFLCRKFLINKKQLYALFKENFNMTVKEYILNKKIDLAIHLLRTTKKPLAEISSLIGFSDYNNFIQRFKKQTGVTPHRFRLKSG